MRIVNMKQLRNNDGDIIGSSVLRTTNSYCNGKLLCFIDALSHFLESSHFHAAANILRHSHKNKIEFGVTHVTVAISIQESTFATLQIDSAILLNQNPTFK